jgi:sugar phosphate isomerase/epimerase
MPARERFGFFAHPGTPIEAVLRWGAEHGFTSCDFNADFNPNGLGDFDDAERVRDVRELCERHGITLALHSTSGINMAEVGPYVSEAVDEYNRAYIRLARRLGCAAVIVHGGIHFKDVERRKNAAVDRLRRLLPLAESEKVELWFENHNTEPEHAEIHYIPDNVEETAWFLDAPGLKDSPWLKWSFNAGHAHLVPDGVQGFLDAFGVDRIAQVRLTDNPGTYELHLIPGQGTVDFPDTFQRLGKAGYAGPYCLDFGATDEDYLGIAEKWVTLPG